MVDHFRVLRLLGRGGMSEVYLARDTRLGRKVALKLMLGHQASSPALRRLLRAEAQATASFSHPNIVTIHHVGEHAGSPYLALEYLEGETLAHRLRRGRLGVKELARIALEIAEGLQEAHAHKILHRDLKPENVVITTSGRTKVLDFGIAIAAAEVRAEPDQASHLTVAPASAAAGLELPGSGSGELLEAAFTEPTVVVSSSGVTAMEVKGTPLYMAPEQWRREESTGAVDIWALGMILHLAALGRLPYPVRTSDELLAAVSSPEPVPLQPVEEAAPPLARLIERCLAKEASRRPTAAEVAAALRQVLEGERDALPDDACPFRGLLPFNEEHATLFYGRGAEITAFVERLRQQPMLAVVGPSGAGKSSFVHAGVVPRLREQGSWLVLAVRPGTAPFEQLASRLLALQASATGGPPPGSDELEQARELARAARAAGRPGPQAPAPRRAGAGPGAPRRRPARGALHADGARGDAATLHAGGDPGRG